ncbi:Ger(x)C family spore germination protein [Pseudogracilibacillus sp. SO30301A]|uniref:Ger(x)C family spore germination protein n=1 Tax=Pseudogracilibacillus sp. SO30301A TaxID=3098291 RepID=UPI00300DE821
MNYKVLIIVVMLFLLVGCWNIEEADRLDYVHGIGIDYEDGKIKIYLQIVNLGNLGTPDVAATGESQVTIAHASAEDMESAIFEIYKSAQKKLYWGHTTFIMLSEAALEHNKLKEVLDLINRFPETRYRIRIFATKSKITELMEVSPIFQGSPIFSRLTDLNNEYEQSSWMKPLTNRELIISLDEPGHNGIIPTVRLAENTWQSEKEPEPMVEALGIASVSADEFHGFILGKDVNGLRWIQEKSKRGNVTIFNKGKPAAGVVIVKPETKFDINTEGDKVTFHAKFKAKGMINEMLQNVDQKFIIEELKKRIKKEIMQTYRSGLEIDSDVYRLSETLYRKDVKTWKKLEKDGKIPLDEKSLQIEVNLDLVNSKLNKTEPIIE